MSSTCRPTPRQGCGSIWTPSPTAFCPSRLVGYDPLVGDTTTQYVFSGERSVGGLLFADQVSVFRGERLYMQAHVSEVEINPTFNTNEFDAPHWRPLTTAISVNPLGHGAYEIAGIEDGAFRVVFFDLGDGVAVFDAPESRTRSAWVASEIQRTLGPKPIRYLILSHFHDDHIAGIGYYVDQGAQIVTVRSNASLVARYARVNSQLHPDLASAGRQPAFLFVDGDHVDLASGDHALRVYRLADCPHAKDMLLAYQPAEHLIVQADLFVELAAYSPTSAAFAAWMRRADAPAIDSIIGTHSERISRAALKASPSGETWRRRSEMSRRQTAWAACVRGFQPGRIAGAMPLF